MKQISTENIVNVDLPTNNNVNYFLADSGYAIPKKYEIHWRASLKFVPLIPHNKRNTKDIKKIVKISKKDYNTYKKRIKIEHVFGSMKNNKKLLTRYEKLSETFLNFVVIHFIKVLESM